MAVVSKKIPFGKWRRWHRHLDQQLHAEEGVLHRVLAVDRASATGVALQRSTRPVYRWHAPDDAAAGPVDEQRQPWPCAGDKLRQALRRIGKWTIEIVKRSDAAEGFEVLPRRWVAERTLAWLNRNRRLAKDFKQTIVSATAWLFIASIQPVTRRIARL